MLTLYIISPNGKLVIGCGKQKVVYGISREPLKFAIPVIDQSAIIDLRMNQTGLTVVGEAISLSAEGQPLSARVMRSLLLDGIEQVFTAMDIPTTVTGRDKNPGYPLDTRFPAAQSLDGVSPAKKGETTLRLGRRLDPMGWNATYTTFPKLKAAITSSQTTGIELDNLAQVPAWAQATAGRSSPGIAGVATTSGSAVIKANGVNSLFSDLDVDADIANVTGTGIPASTTISSVTDPLTATMSANATVTETVTVRLRGGVMVIDEELIFFKTVNSALNTPVTGPAGQVNGVVRNSGSALAAAQSHAKDAQAFFLIPWEVYGTITSFALDWDVRDADDLDGGSNKYGFTMNFGKGRTLAAA